MSAYQQHYLTLVIMSDGWTDGHRMMVNTTSGRYFVGYKLVDGGDSDTRPQFWRGTPLNFYIIIFRIQVVIKAFGSFEK